MKYYYKDFIPKSFTCFQEGYSRKYFINDLVAGIGVGIISLPLALAFAIASGVSPEKGLFTAIIAGFIISLLGGSRVQIGGPTGAFVIIIYEVMQKFGYDGLAVATLIASIMIILMGLARFGAFLKFIPYPVTTGFTSGIAVVIFISQIKDFFGLDIENLPPQFIDKCKIYCQLAHTFNIWAFLVAFTTVFLIFILRRIYPKIPGAIVAIVFATVITYSLDIPIETIENKFGEIPRTLPMPSFPNISYSLVQDVFPYAITIALIGGLESLLSAVIADGVTGHKHRSNGELLAQGLANIGSVIFGGIPATGAIARTSANIRMGAKTPLAGMIHAITILLLMIFFAPLVGKVPLAALSGVLIFIAWNMSELPHFIEILKGQKGDAIVLLTTFFLTVFIDLAVAIQIGVLLAAVVFLKHMTDKTTVKICKIVDRENMDEEANLHDSELLFRKDIPSDIAIFEINGPFFYSVADQLDDVLIHMEIKPRVFILDISKAPLIDATGLNAIKKFGIKCKKIGIVFCISGADDSKRELLKKSSVKKTIGEDHIFSSIQEALKNKDLAHLCVNRL